jgi:hypothetical protein
VPELPDGSRRLADEPSRSPSNRVPWKVDFGLAHVRQAGALTAVSIVRDRQSATAREHRRQITAIGAGPSCTTLHVAKLVPVSEACAT